MHYILVLTRDQSDAELASNQRIRDEGNTPITPYPVHGIWVIPEADRAMAIKEANRIALAYFAEHDHSEFGRCLDPAEYHGDVDGDEPVVNGTIIYGISTVEMHFTLFIA